MRKEFGKGVNPRGLEIEWRYMVCVDSGGGDTALGEDACERHNEAF